MSESKARAIRERDRLATLLVNLMCDLDALDGEDTVSVASIRMLPSYNAVLRSMGGSVKGAVDEDR